MTERQQKNTQKSTKEHKSFHARIKISRGFLWFGWQISGPINCKNMGEFIVLCNVWLLFKHLLSASCSFVKSRLDLKLSWPILFISAGWEMRHEFQPLLLTVQMVYQEETKPKFSLSFINFFLLFFCFLWFMSEWSRLENLWSPTLLTMTYRAIHLQN